MVLNPGMEEELRKVLMRQLPVFSGVEEDDLLLISRKNPLMEGLISPEVFAGIPGPPGPPAAAPLSLTVPPAPEGERVLINMTISGTASDYWFTSFNLPPTDGKLSYLGVANPADRLYWDGTLMQWLIYIDAIGGGFWNIQNTVLPPETGWLPAVAGAGTVNSVDSGGVQASQLGQLAIVRTTNDSGSFEDVWTNSNLSPMIWQPPGHIFRDRNSGAYYRIFYENGEADTELAYP